MKSTPWRFASLCFIRQTQAITGAWIETIVVGACVYSRQGGIWERFVGVIQPTLNMIILEGREIWLGYNMIVFSSLRSQASRPTLPHLVPRAAFHAPQLTISLLRASPAWRYSHSQHSGCCSCTSATGQCRSSHGACDRVRPVYGWGSALVCSQG